MTDNFDMERYLNDREGCVREWEAKHGTPSRPQASPAEVRRLKEEALKNSKEAGKHHENSYAYEQSHGCANHALNELRLLDPALAESVSREAAGAVDRSRAEVQAKEERFSNSVPGKISNAVSWILSCHCRCHSDPSYTGCNGNCCPTDV